MVTVGNKSDLFSQAGRVIAVTWYCSLTLATKNCKRISDAEEVTGVSMNQVVPPGYFLVPVTTFNRFGCCHETLVFCLLNAKKSNCSDKSFIF